MRRAAGNEDDIAFLNRDLLKHREVAGRDFVHPFGGGHLLAHARVKESVLGSTEDVPSLTLGAAEVIGARGVKLDGEIFLSIKQLDEQWKFVRGAEMIAGDQVAQRGPRAVGKVRRMLGEIDDLPGFTNSAVADVLAPSRQSLATPWPFNQVGVAKKRRMPLY